MPHELQKTEAAYMVDAGTVVKEIQEMRDGGFLSDAILRKAVRSISVADDRYDWVGVYLVGLSLIHI